MSKRRLKLVGHIPEGPRATFEVWPTRAGSHWYHCRIRDRCDRDDQPEFILQLGKDPSRWPVPLRVACAAAGQMVEALGWIVLRRHRDGVPDLQAVYVSTSRHVLCVWSTSPEEAPVDHPALLFPDYPARAARAIEEARRGRGSPDVPVDPDSLLFLTDLIEPPLPGGLQCLRTPSHIKENTVPDATATKPLSPKQLTQKAAAAEKKVGKLTEDLKAAHERVGKLTEDYLAASKELLELRRQQQGQSGDTAPPAEPID